MTPERVHTITLIAIAKLFSEQSTFVIGEFQRENKYRFNLAVSGVDNLISSIEAGLDDFDKETLAILTDSLHDGIKNLKKELEESTNKERLAS